MIDEAKQWTLIALAAVAVVVVAVVLGVLGECGRRNLGSCFGVPPAAGDRPEYF